MTKSDLVSFVILIVINSLLVFFAGWLKGYKEAKTEWYTRGWAIGRHSAGRGAN